MSEDELRQELFDAVGSGDGEAFSALLREHADAISRAFPSWTKVPATIRSSPDALRAWANGLIAIAGAFEQTGHPALMARLRAGETGDNPIERWGAAMEAAANHSGAGQHAAAVRLLEPVVSEMEKCRGTAVDAYRAKALGALGAAYFLLGDVVNAEQRMLEALEECRRTGDAEGVQVYERNLAHIASRKPTS